MPSPIGFQLAPMLDIVFLLLVFFSLPGGKQHAFPDDRNVKELNVPAEDSYRRAVLPDKPFDQDRIKAVDKYFISKSVRGQFNGVVLFADRDKIFSKAYGYSNFRTKEKLSTSSVFQLASISKTITATAVLMLAQQGLVDIKAPVSDYLEGFGRPTLTVEMLLSHKSGLADYTRFTAGVWIGFMKPMSNEDMLSIMLKRKPRPYFSPGLKYQYSNTNYALLASIVEHVTGESFSSWVRRNIFEPVGMDNTFFCTEPEFSRCGTMTQGYTSRRAPYGLNFLDGVLGDKGVYSTAEDLLKFDMALREGFILDDHWQQKAYTNYTDQVHPYGYGWRLYNYNDREIVYHNGWWHGYRGRFLRLPEEQKTIIVLENQARSSFSVPTLMNISEKLFDPYVSDTTVVESGAEDTEDETMP